MTILFKGGPLDGLIINVKDPPPAHIYISLPPQLGGASGGYEFVGGLYEHRLQSKSDAEIDTQLE